MARARLTPHQRLAAYVRTLAPLMGLGRWTITVDAEPCAAEHAATIQPGSEYYVATMRVASGFWAEPREAQRETVAHELVHLWMWRFEEAHGQGRAIIRGKGAQASLAVAYEQAEEYAVDGIARAWSERLPLPGRLA